MSTAIPNLRHLQIASEIVRRGSISAAARAMHVSQPAVTQAVKALENLFAARLFDRTSVGMTLTVSGTQCLIRIERALVQIAEAINEARRSKVGSKARGSTTNSTQLQALVAVVEQRGFSAAARTLKVSRASLHRAARDLERSIATPLFEKTSFGVEPTREAEELARRLRLAFVELEQARAVVSALAGGDRGRTVIGAMPLARSLLVPTAVTAFAVDYPQHTIGILDGPYDSMLDALRKGSADVLVGALRDPLPYRDIVQETLFDDPLAIIVRMGHPLARRKRVGVRELAAFAWIAPRAGSPLRRQYEELFRSANLAFPVGAIECNSLVAARALLMASDRVMLLSAHQVHHELANGELMTLPHPLGHMVRSIGLTMRRDWRPTEAQSSLLNRLRSSAKTASQKAAAVAPAVVQSPRSTSRNAFGETRMRCEKKRLK